jgi:hypothetical protein
VPGTPTEQPTETVYGYRASSGTYSQPAPPSPAQPPQPPQPPQPWQPPQPAYPPAPGRRSSGRGRALWIVIPLVAIVAGGGAYAAVKALGKHPTAQSSTPPTVHASTPPASTPPPASATASASTTASASVTATPAPSPSLVAIGPGVATGTAIAPVETLLSTYFQGINTHNYGEYSGTLTAQNKADQTQSSFDSGYSTTTDSDMTLTSVTSTGGGDLTATVTFTSHQSPADSVDNSACNDWTLNFYLAPNGTGYLIAPAPAGSPQPTYSDC